MKKVLVIVGPTASGKTSLGIELARKYNGEIISGDSVQIYKGLDIGSAKATKEERDSAVHHLIDIKEADENYSVKEFQERARYYIDDISSRGKLPIIVGGTGLYIKACLYDYVFLDEETEDDQYEGFSNEQLVARLREVDAAALEKIHPNNRKRLVRALNIYEKHARGISELKAQQKHECLYDALIIGLTKSREILYQQIDDRIDRMLEDGLLKEIEDLLKNGISFENQSMSAIGYKEFRPYFEGTSSLEECIREVKRNTRHLAKRQYTWFRHQLDVTWAEEKETALKAVEEWYGE